MNTKVVYTCITNGYDKLIEPKIKTDGFDYICFTDSDNLTSKNWKIVKLDENDFKDVPVIKKQRLVKILSHKFLKEYDISVYVDGNIKINGNLNEFISTLDFSNYSVFIPYHPVRKCIYAEMKAVISMKKDKTDLPKKQIDMYKSEGFPSNFGLCQTNIIVRKHNDENCIKLMEMWWNELSKYSHRDQLSLQYCEWKSGIKIKKINKNTCNSIFFKTLLHQKVYLNKTVIIKKTINNPFV